jgi:hypothetical protein
MKYLRIAAAFTLGFLNTLSFGEADDLGPQGCVCRCIDSYVQGGPYGGPRCREYAITGDRVRDDRCCGVSDDDNVGDFFSFLDTSEYLGRALSVSDVDLHGCDEEDYELLFVGFGKHFVIAAKSECVGTDEICKCPSVLVFHQASIFEENRIKGVKKQIREVREDALVQHDSLTLGSFSLGTIVESYNNARSETKVHDLISHNCAGLLIEMGLELGIDPTDKSIATYATNHLSSNANGYMMDGLSDNDFRLAMENTNSNNDQYTVIEDFVKNYISERV